MTTTSITEYTQGVYAGPNTVRAMDYNGHEAIGVQISDEAPDGSCFLVTLDEYMQVSVTPVMANSIKSYDPEQPPESPECSIEDQTATENALIDLWNRVSAQEITTPIQLANIAIVAKNLSVIWSNRLLRLAQNLHQIQKGQTA